MTVKRYINLTNSFNNTDIDYIRYPPPFHRYVFINAKHRKSEITELTEMRHHLMRPALTYDIKIMIFKVIVYTSQNNV